jgi:tetratricopeptide (TPR) repeat protein
MRATSWLAKVVVVALAAVMVVGCSSSNKEPKKKKLTQRQQGERDWKMARAAVLLSLAKDQYATGNFDKSRQTVDDALRLAPDHAGLRILSAKLSVEQGRLELADADLAKARKLEPKNAEADYLSGVVYQRWQQPEKALGYYTAANTKAPTELAYLLARAEMLVATGDRPLALSLLQEKVVYFEHSAAIRDAVGQLLVQEGRYREAIESLRSATILTPDDLTMREHLAMALLYNKQYREAIASIDRLLKADEYKDRADLYVALGECRMQLGQYRDARDTFDKATQLAPASTEAWLSLAKAAMQLNDHRRAEAALRKALSIQAGSSEAHLMLGYLRLRQNRLSDALAAFHKSSVLDQSDTVSLCMVGFVMEKMGRPNEAVKYYAKALKLKPNDEMAAKLMAAIELKD